LKHYAESLERSNKELEHFAYVASHDLQEPLRKIGSFTELLARKYQGRLDDKADSYIGYIVDGAQRMQVLINDLLAFSRVTTKGKEFAPVDCNVLLARLRQDLELALKESGAHLSVAELPTVRADAVQLGQVFQNLIANAIKYCVVGHPPRDCGGGSGAGRRLAVFGAG
ncbi:MAG: histidine kinase dimerization/phospho-acceptor domain-containing protein, partial [Desulfurivibrionaceae bacterium]|nr:histidine kinase dimerization/phospho-acceptor domain-containing protein [Desulfurivibrionaceae bacterium]